ncbi:MAG: thioredoxin-disulfide reductase [Flavobacteriales bacterium]|nr:thioredoxin-disulfide reductase [Flavobacteriales bacterium]
MENSVLDCVIIGSGPAGYTAAIYASRADLKPVLYTGMELGGQLTTTTEVENFPGYPDGITGPEMMEDLKKQAERFGTKVIIDYITKVELSKEKGGIHKVYTSSEEIHAKTVIISTGASAKYLGLECEKKYQGGGVSACATCDGFFYKNKPVVVVGGGDTAAEEATYLAKLCSKVTMLVRKGEFRASKAMINRVENTPNIEVLFFHELKEIEGDGVVETVIAYDNRTNEETKITADGIFIAIGHKPNTDLFLGQLDADESGYLITEKGTSKTNIPGVFAAGDVQDKHYRQAITAAGSGCMAALDAERYLASLED